MKKPSGGFVSIGLRFPTAMKSFRNVFLSEFLPIEKILLTCVGENGTWKLLSTMNWSRPVQQDRKSIKEVRCQNEEDWPADHHFLKPRISDWMILGSGEPDLSH